MSIPAKLFKKGTWIESGGAPHLHVGSVVQDSSFRVKDKSDMGSMVQRSPVSPAAGRWVTQFDR